jgi:hypothetical protein
MTGNRQGTEFVPGKAWRPVVIPGRLRSKRTRNPEAPCIASGFRVRPSGVPE